MKFPPSPQGETGNNTCRGTASSSQWEIHRGTQRQHSSTCYTERCYSSRGQSTAYGSRPERETSFCAGYSTTYQRYYCEEYTFQRWDDTYHQCGRGRACCATGLGTRNQ